MQTIKDHTVESIKVISFYTQKKWFANKSPTEQCSNLQTIKNHL